MLPARKAKLPRNGVLGALLRPSPPRPLRLPISIHHARHASSSARAAFQNLFKPRPLGKSYRQKRLETSIVVLLLSSSIGLCAYATYSFLSWYFALSNRYPPEVAKQLRRALYYSYANDVEGALRYFDRAIEECHKHGLDPFSAEVMGIRIRTAQLFEEIGDFKAAADILSNVLSDDKKWLHICATAPQTLPRAPLPGTVIGEGESQRTITQAEFDHWLWSSRNYVLGKSCAIGTKLGELYADAHVMEQDKSHEALMWAVETSLKEFRRRATEGVKEGEGDWLSPQEIGGALESLAHSYERREEFDLALPLFFQALRLCKDQCHMAVIMNNLAVSFAQHPPRAPFESLAGIVPGEKGQGPAPTTTPDQPWTRKELVDAARRWAKNALSHAKEPKGDKRTPECDQACAVALVNLGDIAALAGNYTEARRRYEQGIKVSEKNDFADGIRQAQAGLAKLA